MKVSLLLSIEPWQKIVSNYSEKIYFVGFYDEYKEFIKKVGYVDYFYTSSLMDVFDVLAGCSLFIGNQSFAYSLIEGMKKPSIQETDYNGLPNCKYYRKNSYLADTKDNIEFLLIDKFIKSYL